MPQISRKDFTMRMQRIYRAKFVRFRQVESIAALMEEQPDGKLAPLAIGCNNEVCEALGITEDMFWKSVNFYRKSNPDNPIWEAAEKYHTLRCLEVNGYSMLCHYITKPSENPADPNHVYTPMYILTDQTLREEICAQNNSAYVLV
jgi:hypothetical protein